MLVRGFRLTDKLSNAFLKLAVWLVSGFLQQLSELRQTGQTTAENLYTSVSGATDVVVRGSRKAYDATGTRQRGLMVQRAAMGVAEGDAKAMMVEDPLVTQNRTLSVFAVVLMISLIAVVIWSTGRPNENNGRTIGGGLPEQANEPTAALLPSATPSLTRDIDFFSPRKWAGRYFCLATGQHSTYPLDQYACG